MWEVEEVTTPMARNDYHCQASDWIDNAGFQDADYTHSESQTIEKAKGEGFKILKGTRYLKVRGKWEGEWQTFRARLDLDEICKKYDLYSN